MNDPVAKIDSQGWTNLICPHCDNINWLSINSRDQTLPDLESIECHSCEKKSWLFNKEERDDFGIEGDLNESYSKKGLQNPSQYTPD